jgi:tetratricopeptide (TPR) repeat protein
LQTDRLLRARLSSCNLIGRICYLIIALFILDSGRTYLSSTASNIGLLYLNIATVESDSSRASALSLASETWLKQAITVHDNRSAWRGLGFLYSRQRNEGDAIKAWQKANEMEKELIRWGLQKQRARQHDEAVRWYIRAASVDQQLGDPWYFVALAQHEQRQWDESLQSIKKALQSSYFQNVGVSDVYLLQGAIIQVTQGPQGFSQALESINIALTLDAFSSNAVKAEAFHKRGFLYEGTGRDQQEVITEYQQALALQPEHHWARLRLGYALYLANGNVAQAEHEMNEAIALGGDDLFQKWAHRYLGDLYRLENRVSEAIAAYQNVLQIDPMDEEVSRLLAELLVLQPN